MNYDHHFEIGSTHKICQDFAISGETQNCIDYAIVCDGCSMSGETTPIDVGARLLAFSTIKLINGAFIFRQPIDFFVQNIKKSVEETAEFFEISRRFFDATLVAAFTNQEVVRIFIIGDGGFFIKRKNSNIVQFIVLEYTSGAPFYISYLLGNDVYKKKYIEEFGNSKVFVKTYWIDIVDKKVVDSSSYSTKVDEKFSHNNIWTYNISDIECVGVFSDGIQSFEKDGKSIDFAEIASEFASFKNYNGKFVERRLGNGLNKKCQKEGIHHYDDISCAAIKFN